LHFFPDLPERPARRHPEIEPPGPKRVTLVIFPSATRTADDTRSRHAGFLRNDDGRGNDWVKVTCKQRKTLPIAGFALNLPARQRHVQADRPWRDALVVV
jgi:hypothetical protein